MSQLGGGGGVCHVTVLPGHSQENQIYPQLTSIVHGGLPDFPVSPCSSCGPIGDAARPATQPIRMEDTYHIF
jgi:hypothetical protein